MKLIVGLGNPGPAYAATRHNVGFLVVERLAVRFEIAVESRRFKGRFGKGRWAAESVGLLEPGTFMNASGEAVLAAVRELDVAASELVVVYDDVDFPLGTVRIAQRGSHGGHKGIRSIIAELGTEEFARARVGVGRPTVRGDVSEWVLSPFGEDEIEARDQAIERAAEAVETILRRGVTAAMNQYNRR